MLDFNNIDTPEAKQHVLDIERIRKEASDKMPNILFYLFPNGEMRGKRFYIGNTRGDKGKSLIIETTGSRAGQWHDFAEATGGDIFRLWALAQGISDNRLGFPKVLDSMAEYLNTSVGIDDDVNNNKVIPLPTRKQQIAGKETPPLDELGAYTAKWDYLDENSKLIACVYRYDPPSGKEFRLWDARNKRAAAPSPRPLYQIPLILSSETIVIVEGEKCADALISQGIAATTAMNGAMAPLDKTDWSPLTNKQVIIWPDNDDAGKTYAQKLYSYLQEKGICNSITVLTPPSHKPKKWDAANAVSEGFAIHSFISSSQETLGNNDSFEGISPTKWQGTPPERNWIIEDWLPRGYVTALYGDGGVGKSLLSQQLMTCLATGKPWLGLATTPMRVYGLMCEDDESELWRRQYNINNALGLRMTSLNNMRFISRIGFNNLLMTFDGKDSGKHTSFFNELLNDIITFSPDVVVLDTAADLFGGNEINRTQVRQFIQNACGYIARRINGAVLLCAHPSDTGIQRNTGTGGSTAWNNTVRSRWYLSAASSTTEEDGNGNGNGNSNTNSNSNERILSRKKSNYATSGENINLLWKDGAFISFIPDPHSKRYIGNKIAEKHERERGRKKDAILDLIASEALEGRVYTANQFANKFEDKSRLGSESTIKRRIAIYSTKGWIKYCQEFKSYNLPAPISRQGYLCVKGMRIATNREEFNPETQELERITIPFYPTHYRHSGTSQLELIENPQVWIEQEGDENE